MSIVCEDWYCSTSCLSFDYLGESLNAFEDDGFILSILVKLSTLFLSQYVINVSLVDKRVCLDPPPPEQDMERVEKVPKFQRPTHYRPWNGIPKRFKGQYYQGDQLEYRCKPG